MRGFYPYLLLIFVLVISSCKKNNFDIPILLDQLNLNLSECNVYPNSSVDITPSLQLKASKNGNLHLSFYNAEFCCGTDSVTIKNSTSQTSLQLELELELEDILIVFVLVLLISPYLISPTKSISFN